MTLSHSAKSQRDDRLRTLILILPALSTAFGILLGLRAAVAGRQPLIQSDFTFGSLFTLIIAVLVGYFLYAPGKIHVRWQPILASIYLTVPLTVVLYTQLDQTPLSWFVRGIHDSAAADPSSRLIIGMLDGVLYGSIAGFIITTYLDPHPPRFTRMSVIRFGVIYALLMGGIGASILLKFAGVHDLIANLFGLLMLELTRQGTKRAQRA